MKISIYKSYDDLPLFLNAETVAKVLGVSQVQVSRLERRGIGHLRESFGP